MIKVSDYCGRFVFPVVAGVEGFAAGTGVFAAGVAVATDGFGAALEFADAFKLPFDILVTEPVVGAGVAVVPPTGAGRAPLSSFGLSTTFLAR